MRKSISNEFVVVKADDNGVSSFGLPLFVASKSPFCNFGELFESIHDVPLSADCIECVEGVVE